MTRAISASLVMRLCACLALLAAVLAVGPAATATKPLKVEFPVDISYLSNDLTEVCGFDVWFSMVGTFKGTIFHSSSGAISGEFDSQPNTTITYSSPDSGKSFSFKFSTTFHNKYPDGVDPGDRVIASATGFLEKFPGLPAAAGRIYFPDGEVLFVEDGIPYVDYGEPTLQVGHQNDDPDIAICAALAP